MNVLIVDDEKDNRALLDKLLKNIPLVSDIREADSAVAALNILSTFRPDVILLDVEMPGLSGFDFLESLPKNQFKIVFVTAHKDYAVDAVKTQAVDYLLKPINREMLEKLMLRLSVNALQPQVSNGLRDKIKISTLEETHFIRIEDIMHVSSAGNYSIYHLVDGREIVASHILKNALDQLPQDYFIRVHHSHVVNLNFIDKMTKKDGHEIVLKNQFKIPLSRRKKDEFMAFIDRL